MSQVVLRVRAQLDIEAAFAGIADRNPVSARRFLAAVARTCDVLTRLPGAVPHRV
ncbi:MAG: hypothetical protein U0746_07990 [Gemmataceae bacterium]